jgi:glutamate/aspartate transport system permease protein
LAVDWQVFCKETTTGEQIAGCFGHGRDLTYLDWLLSAWGWTLKVSVLALILALLLGGLIGVMRTLPSRPWALVGEAWTEIFRNNPLIVQIFIWYHVLPALWLPLRGLPSFVLVVFALGCFTSARVAEQLKAGILTLPRGQREAGLALGLTLAQTYRHVLLPRALRIIVPPLTSEAMNIVKNSSVAFAVSIAELTFFAQQAAEETAQPILMYGVVTLLYAASALAINRIARLIERRVRVPGMLGGAQG